MIREDPVTSILEMSCPSPHCSFWEAGMSPPSHHCFSCHVGSLSQCNKTRRGSKGVWIGKKEVKLSLFTDHMIFYVENKKDLTKKGPPGTNKQL
jgi:hypothetical protein